MQIQSTEKVSSMSHKKVLEHVELWDGGMSNKGKQFHMERTKLGEDEKVTFVSPLQFNPKRSEPII